MGIRSGGRTPCDVRIALLGGVLGAMVAAAGPAPADETPRPAKQAASLPRKHPLDAFLRAAEQSQKSLAAVNDYTAIFRKLEVVRGRPFPHAMYMKFRRKPFSVYLYFLENHRGRQVLFVSGRNEGKLLARGPGIAGLSVTVALKPDSPQALAEARYPITKIGMANMLQEVVTQWKKDRSRKDIKVAYYPDAKLKRVEKMYQPMDCKVFESAHTQVHKEQEVFMTRLYIDKKTNLPVRVEQFGYPVRPGARPPLLAEYTYWNVRVNVGLKDADFDRNNPKYGL